MIEDACFLSLLTNPILNKTCNKGNKYIEAHRTILCIT